MKKRILTVIGARPQIIKAAAVSRVASADFRDRISELILHTGQHYDDAMSGVFFQELGIPAPHYNLGVGSGSHGFQTAGMIQGIEQVLMKERPDALLVYGDTNSTLAGALAASKMQIPVVHVEAGLRSFDKTMPEEVNRIVADHLSTILFAPTDTALKNLAAEGIVTAPEGNHSADLPLVVKTGDVMFDNALYYRKQKNGVSGYRQPFILATIHRDHNTDNPGRLKDLLEAIAAAAAEVRLPVVLPLHPRTRNALSTLLEDGWKMPDSIHIQEPASYLGMMDLEESCSLVITDSGGVQKEAYFFHKPCIILRPQTEWVEIVATGNAVIADNQFDLIVGAAKQFISRPPAQWPEIFGDGNAASHIIRTMLDHI